MEVDIYRFWLNLRQCLDFRVIIMDLGDLDVASVDLDAAWDSHFSALPRHSPNPLNGLGVIPDEYLFSAVFLSPQYIARGDGDTLYVAVFDPSMHGGPIDRGRVLRERLLAAFLPKDQPDHFDASRYKRKRYAQRASSGCARMTRLNTRQLVDAATTEKACA